MSGSDSGIRVVGSLLRQRATDRPSFRFLTCAADSLTYAELDHRTDAVAAGFAAQGVSKGDRVAILTPNRLEMIEMIFALAKIGSIQVPLNAFLKGEFLRYQVADSQATVMVVDSDGLDALRPLLDQLPDLRLIVLLDPPGAGDAPPVPTIGYAELRDCTDMPPEVELAPADTMSIVYTSGTTGLPKGCILSHGYYIRVARVTAEALELTSDDVVYSALPLFHGGCRMMVLTMALVKDAPVTIDPAFSARNILPRCKEVDATVIIGMGVMGAAMLATPESPADRDHRVHTMMMAPMTPPVQEIFMARFGIDPWVEAYGQTECVPLLATPRSKMRDRAGCGIPAADLDVALLDDDDHPVPDGEIGEICMRPRFPLSMFDGYWGKPDATVSQFRNLWYHTGDFGKMLPSGSVTFVDRKKDALRRRSENVSSIELETSIMGHPKVAEVAVHAVPSEMTEDDIKACIVLKDGESTTPEELFGFFKDRIPYFAMPRYVELIDALPRNAVGRIMKHKLRERPVTEQVWDFNALGLELTRTDRRKVGSSS